jgi:hypothetical protein
MICLSLSRLVPECSPNLKWSGCQPAGVNTGEYSSQTVQKGKAVQDFTDKCSAQGGPISGLAAARLYSCSVILSQKKALVGARTQRTSQAVLFTT